MNAQQVGERVRVGDVVVRLRDDEILEGDAAGLDMDQPDFVVTVSDPGSNNRSALVPVAGSQPGAIIFITRYIEDPSRNTATTAALVHVTVTAVGGVVVSAVGVMSSMTTATVMTTTVKGEDDRAGHGERHQSRGHHKNACEVGSTESHTLPPCHRVYIRGVA